MSDVFHPLRGEMIAPIPFPRKEGPPGMSRPALELPGPRIWQPADLARFLGVSRSWIYKRTEASAEDPIPRVRGVGRLRFDTQSLNFLEWMRRQLGDVDMEQLDA